MKKDGKSLGSLVTLVIIVMIATAIVTATIAVMWMDAPEPDRKSGRKVYAMIQMPDGSVVSGECSGYDRNDRYVAVYMGNQVYKASDWRVVIWYEQPKQGR